MIPLAGYMLLLTIGYAFSTVVNEEAGKTLLPELLQFLYSYIGVSLYCLFLIWKTRATILGTLILSIIILIAFGFLFLARNVNDFSEIFTK
jgi:hypothetical protein